MMRVKLEAKFNEPEPGTDEAYILNEEAYYRSYPRLTPSDVWIDVGAHLGSFTCRIAPLVKRVIAVEPNPPMVEKLRRNVVLNDLSNVIIDDRAVVSTDDEETTLWTNPLFTRMSTTLRSRKGYDELQVKTVRLNSLISRHGATKVKMDCEGEEVGILYDTDWSNIEELTFEYHYKLLKDYFRERARELAKFLESQFDHVLMLGLEKKSWTGTCICWRD